MSKNNSMRYAFPELNGSVRGVPSGAPMIVVDECMNSRATQQLVVGLCGSGLAHGSDSLWYQRREREDGSRMVLHGGPPLDWKVPDSGLPIRGESCDDQTIVATLIGKFGYARPLVLLSKNTRLDEFGLRRLLQDEVAPALKNHPDGMSTTEWLALGAFLIAALNTLGTVYIARREGRLSRRQRDLEDEWLEYRHELVAVGREHAETAAIKLVCYTKDRLTIENVGGAEARDISVVCPCPDGRRSGTLRPA